MEQEKYKEMLGVVMENTKVREIKKEPECLEVHSSPKRYKRLYQEYRNKATILAKKLWHKNVVISFLVTYLLFSKGWIIVSTLFGTVMVGISLVILIYQMLKEWDNM